MSGNHLLRGIKVKGEFMKKPRPKAQIKNITVLVTLTEYKRIKSLAKLYVNGNVSAFMRSLVQGVE